MDEEEGAKVFKIGYGLISILKVICMFSKVLTVDTYIYLHINYV